MTAYGSAKGLVPSHSEHARLLLDSTKESRRRDEDHRLCILKQSNNAAAFKRTVHKLPPILVPSYYTSLQQALT